MKIEDKEKLNQLIKLNLKGINVAIGEAVKAKDAWRKRLAVLEGQKDTYTPEYIELEQYLALAKHTRLMRGAHEDMVKRLENLRDYINERDANLDLDNPALTNALNLINTVGDDLTYETKMQVNQALAGDQPGLRVLQQAYKAADISDAGLDKMVYNADETIDMLKVDAFNAFIQRGSLNYFAGNVNKLAGKEGAQVDTTPDEAGMVEALRQSAGL